jgi:hypothetical protein
MSDSVFFAQTVVGPKAIHQPGASFTYSSKNWKERCLAREKKFEML